MADLAARKPDVVLRLPRPPSVNNAYERKEGFTMHKAPHHKEWIRHARLELWGQNWRPFTGPLAVLYEFPKVNQIEDVANFEKAASDFLVRTSIIKDDSLIWFNAQTWGNSKDMVINLFSLT